MHFQRIRNSVFIVLDEDINPFWIYEALQETEKRFIIRCESIDRYLL